MAQKVQTVYNETQLSVPTSYELPAGSDLEFASSVARINGAGASGTFIVVLDALTQDNKVLASARIDQEFAVGDTGVASWAPFLKRAAAATPAGAFTAQFATRRNALAAQSVVSSTNWTRLDFSAGTSVYSDATRFQTGSFNPDTTEVLKAGLYVVRAVAVWGSGFNAAHGIMLNWDHTAWGVTNVSPRSDADVNFGAGMGIEQTYRIPSGTSSVSAYVFQVSGGNVIVADMLIEIEYIADYQGQPANSSPF